MQTQVHTYAARHISGERGQLGYLLRGCKNSPEIFVLASATLTDSDNQLVFNIPGNAVCIKCRQLVSGHRNTACECAVPSQERTHYFQQYFSAFFENLGSSDYQFH